MIELMKGKKGLVLGIANKHSIALGIAERLAESGATLGFTYLNDETQKRVERFAEKLDVDFVMPCDVTDDQAIKDVCDSFYEKHGNIDFIVHSVAFANGSDLTNGFINSSRQGFLQCIDISVYSLISFCNHAKPYFSKDASVITLSYLGSDRVCAGYNMLGVAKAALNASCKYLADDLGQQGVKINVISAGPLRTSAAMGLPNFKEMLRKRAEMSPLRQNISHEDVAQTSLFLLSNMSSGITGENINVDCGYNIMGTWADARQSA